MTILVTVFFTLLIIVVIKIMARIIAVILLVVFTLFIAGYSMQSHAANCFSIDANGHCVTIQEIEADVDRSIAYTKAAKAKKAENKVVVYQTTVIPTEQESITLSSQGLIIANQLVEVSNYAMQHPEFNKQQQQNILATLESLKVKLTTITAKLKAYKDNLVLNPVRKNDSTQYADNILIVEPVDPTTLLNPDGVTYNIDKVREDYIYKYTTAPNSVQGNIAKLDTLGLETIESNKSLALAMFTVTKQQGSANGKIMMILLTDCTTTQCLINQKAYFYKAELKESANKDTIVYKLMAAKLETFKSLSFFQKLESNKLHNLCSQEGGIQNPDCL